VVGAPPPIPLDLRGHFAGWGGKVEEGDTEGKRSGNKKGLGCAVLKNSFSGWLCMEEKTGPCIKYKFENKKLSYHRDSGCKSP